MRSPLTRRVLLKSSAAAGVLAAGLGPCETTAQTGGAAQPTRQTVRVAVPSFPDQLEPVLVTSTPNYRIVYSCFDSLLRVDHRDGGKLKPALATAWRKSADGTMMDLELRDGVRFHDGRLMTSEDVVFSFSPTRLLGPGGRGLTAAPDFLGTIERVEATGPLAVRVVTKGPDPLLEYRLAGWTSQIMSRQAFESMGGWNRWAMSPVGTGPYRIAEVRPDARIRIEAHEDYWGGRPPFAAIDFRIVPEPASRLNALLARDADLGVDMLPDQLAELERDPRLDVVGGPIASVRLLAIDTNGPVTRDVRIRRALSLAINRDLIIDSLWGGRVTVPNGFQLSEFGDLYLPDFPKPVYDPEAARQLVREAGYRSEPIEYRILNNYYTNEIATAQVLVEMWRAVGIETRLRQVENFSQLYQAPIGGVFNSSTPMQLPDPVGTMWRNFGAGSIFQRRVPIWRNEEFNRLGVILVGSLDVQARRAAHRRMMEIAAHDDPPVILLHTNAVFYGRRRGLNWQPYTVLPMDFGPFNA